MRLFDPVNHDALPLPEGDGLADDARAGSALGALPAPARDGRRRADARVARAELQPDIRLLPRAGAGGGERRRAGHRRLRPPAGRAAPVPQPLDRAAREPRRLPHAADRARSSSCRSTCCSSSRRTSAVRRSSTRRSSGGFSTRCSRRARRSRSSARSSSAAACERGLAYDDALVDGLLSDFYRPRGIPLRGCHPRDLIDQALSLAEYLGEPRRLTRELLRGRVRRLLRRRRGARSGVTRERIRIVRRAVARSSLVRVAAWLRRDCSTPLMRRRPLSVRITSPLGRTGLPGAIRIVAQVSHSPQTRPGAGQVLRERRAGRRRCRRSAVRRRVDGRESLRADANSRRSE